ncbi:Gfo/Idh/MocA family oxidoreductase [Phytohabitans flavus]|nr:Gfo/Idh/MocA family oxidoreductase [Phytohabitans flavus]
MAREETRQGLRVAVVGLEFGRQFVPIYRDHPLVSTVFVADPRDAVRDAVAARCAVAGAYRSLDEVLANPEIDAVHIVTGFADRTAHTVAALDAGKHVACAVPMALSFEDIARIVAARARAGTTYMMMETAVYTREYLFVEDLLRSGALGTINYAKGAHHQDMTNWPAYWMGLPPMHYATHAIAPILRLLDAPAQRVGAVGGGALAAEHRGAGGNRFAVESALVQVAGRDAVVELVRSLFQVAHPASESFSVFGDRQGFEWPQRDGREPLLHTLEAPTAARGRRVTTRSVRAPDRADLLPEPIRRYTRPDPEAGPGALIRHGGHGGSHPHLVHEFVTSIVEKRPPAVDHTRAANWTAVGIAAHMSALGGGTPVGVPAF